MADIPDLTLDNFESEALKADKPALVYYYAPWCKACEEVEEDLNTVADEVAGRLKVVRVNTDKQGDIVKRQRIRTIPSFQILRDGRAASTIQGKPSRLELMEKLSGVLADTPDEESGEAEAEPAGDAAPEDGES